MLALTHFRWTASASSRIRSLGDGKLAIVVRDLLLRSLPRPLFQLPGNPDRLQPVFLLLVDLEQELQRLGVMRGSLQLDEYFFRPVQQARLQVVLAELDHRLQALLLGQVGPLQQIAVHANGAFRFAAPAEKVAQRKMQFDGFRVDSDHLDEGLYGLVRLLVEQEVEPFEVGARQLSRLRNQLLDVDARGEPAQSEEKRESEQPPEFEVHYVFAAGDA
jgi:hypothetical protein